MMVSFLEIINTISPPRKQKPRKYGSLNLDQDGSSPVRGISRSASTSFPPPHPWRSPYLPPETEACPSPLSLGSSTGDVEEEDVPQFKLSGTSTKADDSSPDKDMYGFPLPKNPQYIEEYYATLEATLKVMQTQREKFEELAKEGTLELFEISKQVSTRLRVFVGNIVRQGIPPELRGSLWLLFSGVGVKAKAFEGMYTSILSQRKDVGRFDDDLMRRSSRHASTYSYSAAWQIQMDVTRTFPGFRDNDYLVSLQNVLEAYSLRNPALGYCQSMNFVAGYLLVFLSEDQAFWMLCYVVEELLPEYFARSMSGLVVDLAVFGALVKEYLPLLAAHFSRVGLSISLMCTPWFLCLYVNHLPHETTFRMWDALFFSGTKVIFEVGLAVLKINQDKLMGMTDAVDIITYVNGSMGHLYDAQALFAEMRSLDPTRVEEMRVLQRRKVQAESLLKSSATQINELARATAFTADELRVMWEQFLSLDPYLKHGAVGVDFGDFTRIIAAAVPLWEPSPCMLRNLFTIFDNDKDGTVSFKELVTGLSNLFRGTYEDALAVAFKVFDGDNDGYMDQADVREMLISVFGMFLPSDPAVLQKVEFENTMHFFAQAMFQASSRVAIGDTEKPDTEVSFEDFCEAAEMLQEIMERMRDTHRARAASLDIAESFYSLVFDTERDRAKRDVPILQFRKDSKAKGL